MKVTSVLFLLLAVTAVTQAAETTASALLLDGNDPPKTEQAVPAQAAPAEPAEASTTSDGSGEGEGSGEGSDSVDGAQPHILPLATAPQPHPAVVGPYHPFFNPTGAPPASGSDAAGAGSNGPGPTWIPHPYAHPTHFMMGYPHPAAWGYAPHPAYWGGYPYAHPGFYGAYPYAVPNPYHPAFNPYHPLNVANVNIASAAHVAANAAANAAVSAAVSAAGRIEAANLAAARKEAAGEANVAAATHELTTPGNDQSAKYQAAAQAHVDAINSAARMVDPVGAAFAADKSSSMAPAAAAPVAQPAVAQVAVPVVNGVAQFTAPTQAQADVAPQLQPSKELQDEVHKAHQAETNYNTLVSGAKKVRMQDARPVAQTAAVPVQQQAGQQQASFPLLSLLQMQQQSLERAAASEREERAERREREERADARERAEIRASLARTELLAQRELAVAEKVASAGATLTKKAVTNNEDVSEIDDGEAP